MFVSGAKFEEHCVNISRDIGNWVLYCFRGTTYDDWVMYCFRGTTYDIITSLICITQKCKYLRNEKKIFQKEKRHSSLLWEAFQISSNYFLLHRHFNQHSTRVTVSSKVLLDIIPISHPDRSAVSCTLLFWRNQWPLPNLHHQKTELLKSKARITEYWSFKDFEGRYLPSQENVTIVGQPTHAPPI